MNEISSEQIGTVLKDLNISYKWNNFNLNDKWIVASMFNPVKRGFFYYGLTKKADNLFHDSLILLADPDLCNNQSNQYIVVEDDPQMVFYQILNRLFAQHSSGKVSDLAIIDEEAIIGENVQIDEYAVIGKIKIGDNSIIGSNTVIKDNTDIGKNVIIESGCNIGIMGVSWVWNSEGSKKIVLPQLGGVTIRDNSFIGASATIVRGSLNENTYIGENVLLAPKAHLGHGTVIEDFVHFGANVTTSGNAVIGAYSFLGSGANINPKVVLHPHTIVGASALVNRNTSSEGKTLMGVPAKEYETRSQPSGIPKLHKK